MLQKELQDRNKELLNSMIGENGAKSTILTEKKDNAQSKDDCIQFTLENVRDYQKILEQQILKLNYRSFTNIRLTDEK